MYIHADPTERLEILDAVTPPTLRAGRCKAKDKLLASLKASSLCGVEPPTQR
jgi:hypothetical protein